MYVWGLPQDVTLEEFAELMSKYGIIMEDDEGGCGLFTMSLSGYMYLPRTPEVTVLAVL